MVVTDISPNMASSRLIVKNLPKSVTEPKLRDLFSKQGSVTDIQLKFTPDGKFRSFAFIGFKTPEEAERAISYHNNTYIGATKINVESCAKLGDPSKPRAWSKYAPERNAAKRPKSQLESKSDEFEAAEDSREEKKPKKKTTESEILEKCKEDPLFLEFLETHRKKGAWGNDTIVDELEKLQNASKKGNDKAEKRKEASKDVEHSAVSAEICDDEKIKKKKSKKVVADSDDDTATDQKQKSSKTKQVEGEKKTDGKIAKKKKAKTQPPKKLPEKAFFTLKLRDLPKKAKKQDVKSFFAPLVPKSIRLPPKFRGIAYVGFATKDDQRKAMSKNKSFLLGNRIIIRKYEVVEKPQIEERQRKWTAQEGDLEKEAETVGESGRIFIRNLSYLTNEDEIRTLFEPFGPVTEVHLPIDRLTRQLKGFGFVSFLLPEHAAKAFSELDGTIFQGRMLHLLPSKVKEEPKEDPDGKFKKNQEIKQKKTAGSSFNWNTLFLGQNAISNIVAEKYDVTRKELLLDNKLEDGNNQTSVAVQMALAESEIVDDTRKFLEANGVSIAAFENKKIERSKTTFLVKNLTAKTTAQSLVELFSKHGEIGRVVLPPSGVTAIVEFLEPAEARSAFKKLAYTKFQGLPLYLEWAPLDTFSDVKTISDPIESVNQKPESQIPSQPEEVLDVVDMVPETETVLFVKNLNFDTTEVALKKHFATVGPVYSATIARKKDSKRPDQLLSMGYGFVQFYRTNDTSAALKTLQGTMLNNHILELKRSNRTLEHSDNRQKKGTDDNEAGTKLLVRNVPFQATLDEVKTLFSAFGEIVACRMPTKFDGQHRGFAFIDFHSKHEAKRAYETLSKSTHLYGRRLVLEWAAKNETVEELRQKTAKQFRLQSTGQKEGASSSTKKMITRYFQTNATQATKKANANDDEDGDDDDDN